MPIVTGYIIEKIDISVIFRNNFQGLKKPQFHEQLTISMYRLTGGLGSTCDYYLPNA